MLDNASYHNVQDDKPSSFSSKREKMKDWLDTRGIRYPENSTEIELFQLIKINKPTFQKFSTDSLLARFGHVALRVPPYHPELNPIGKMRAMVKNGGDEECHIPITRRSKTGGRKILLNH
jgi:hypothetical protein